MNHAPTLLLRAVIIFIGVIVLAICTLGFPRLIVSELSGDFDYGPIFIGVLLTAIPFIYALVSAWKLLGKIDENQAFTPGSVDALRQIKLCAYVISASYAAGMPYIFYVADRDDAPGLAALGFVIIGAAFVVGTFAAVSQQLFQNAVTLKSENDLTV